MGIRNKPVAVCSMKPPERLSPLSPPRDGKASGRQSESEDLPLRYCFTAFEDWSQELDKNETGYFIIIGNWLLAQVSVAGLAWGLLCAALLFAAGRMLAQQRRCPAYRRMAAAAPLNRGLCVSSGARK